MITLDGSYGEGGGALIRVALALSTLTGQEFAITNIRSNRPQPGLKAQHLAAIKALKEICQAETNEIDIGTTELHFKPKQIKSGKYIIDIGTAGSITLLLQALILPCLFASRKITLIVKGGTCGKWQASVDYLQQLLLPHLSRFVEKIELKILKRGYYPKGGGEVKLEISPRFKFKDYQSFASFYEDLNHRTNKITLMKQGRLEQIRGIVNCSIVLEEKEVGERIKGSIQTSLEDLGVPINIRVDYANTLSVGGDVLLWALFSNNGKMDYDNPVLLGSSQLIEKGKSSEEIGKNVAKSIKEKITSEAAADSYLTDQLIPFMGLLPDSKILSEEISEHTKTNIYVVERFLPVGFKVENNQIGSLLEKDL